MELQAINVTLEIPEKENSFYEALNSTLSGITKMSESIKNTTPFITANSEKDYKPNL